MATASKTTTTAKKAPARRAPVKKVEHPLADRIPEQEVFTSYVQRVFHQWTDLATLEYCDTNDLNVLLYGPTGPGKSHCVAAYAAMTRKPLVTINCNSAIDPATLFGKPVQVGGKWLWQDSALVTVLRHGGVIHFAEIDQLRKEVSSVFHSLTDSERAMTVIDNNGEYIKAHPAVLLAGSYNHNYGHRPLDPAFKDRFEHELFFDYDETLEQRIIGPEVGDHPMTAILAFVSRLRQMNREGVIDTPVSTRMVRRFVWACIDFGYDYGAMNLLNKFGEDDRAAVRDALEIVSTAIISEISEIEALLE